MAFVKGDRVNLDLDDAGEAHAHSAAFGDIVERQSSGAPAPPTIRTNNKTGFPSLRGIAPRRGAFRGRNTVGIRPLDEKLKDQELPISASGPDDEKRAIDEENKRILASMTDQEIEQERQELLSNLDPELVQKFIMRSSMNEGSNERDFSPDETELSRSTTTSRHEPQPNSSDKKHVSFAATQEHLPISESDNAPPKSSAKCPASTKATERDQTSDSIHFPVPPQPPDLNPDDPEFLKNMHTKYFPNLSYDPNTLFWMTPIDDSDTSSPYHPSHTALSPSELRFDFKGQLLAPSVARSIPTDRGLHHHADAPEAAGYTIPELAVTARSQVAAQRCVAYQTLGRILYRLGQGEFGIEKGRQDTDGPAGMARDAEGESEDGDDEDVGSAMARGLWQCVEEGRVIETLTEDANRTKGHLSARTMAQEALWNWRRGGGRKRQAV